MDLGFELGAGILEPHLGKARIGIGIPAQEIERAVVLRHGARAGAGQRQCTRGTEMREQAAAGHFKALLAGIADRIVGREFPQHVV